MAVVFDSLVNMNAIGEVNKTRNHTIDILKFLAAILITNSHMDVLYPGKFSVLATGGAIGDALFFSARVFFS